MLSASAVAYYNGEALPFQLVAPNISGAMLEAPDEMPISALCRRLFIDSEDSEYRITLCATRYAFRLSAIFARRPMLLEAYLRLNPSR
jgi:hypothetical protein